MDSNEIKKVLKKSIKPLDNFALLLSSGIDSRAIFFEAVEQKKNFVCYTFRLFGIKSRDYIEAKNLSESYGIEHREIILPTDLKTLYVDLRKIKRIGAKKKTDFECFWPFLYVYNEVKEDTIVSGLGADGHFCISKKAMIHYKDNPDAYRALLFGDPNYCQMALHRKHNKGKKHITPFLDSEMIDVFKGSTWNEINKPRQKEAIIKDYKKYFDKIKIYKHQNYQLGDTGISDNFNRLLRTNLNTGNFKSVISIYNRL